MQRMDETCSNLPRRHWLGASLAAGAVLACPSRARAAPVVRPWPADKPTPLLFFIHGGGWMGGDKNGINPKPYLDAGISVVSVNYRYISQAQEVVPPVKAPLHDAARALQFVRSKAREWNLDTQRVCGCGGSADDPPIYLFYDTPLAPGQPTKDPPPSANFGGGLVEKLKSAGVEFEFVYPGAPPVKHPDLFEFIRERLKLLAAK